MRIERVVLEHHRDVALGRADFVDHLAVKRAGSDEIVSSPAIMRSKVDLPQPDGPTSTHSALSGMAIDTPFTASTPPG
jgi:hypothetical protein